MISLVEYDESMAEGVTRMWHESADGWPPGFNCESKTAEYVADKHRDGSYIHTTLAMDGDRVVGYIRTRQYGGEPDAAYVAFVNVVTDMHGRGIGKRLLLDSIDRVTEAGYNRVDLDTWPGNIQAVPLYKKTGFLWVPDRDVHMENYLPLLLRRPEVRELLDGAYWYDHLAHESLDPAPDLQETESGRRVYRYRIEKDGRAVEAEVDLAGRCLSAWKAGGSEYRLSRGGAKPVFGRQVEVRLEGTDLPGGLDVECHEDLEGPERLATDGSAGIMEVLPLPLAMPYGRRERAPRVSVSVPLEEPMPLGMGIDAADAVEVEDLAVRLDPGGREVRLHLKRRIPEGRCLLRWRMDEGGWESRKLDLSKAVFSGVDVPVGDLEPGLHTMELHLDADGAEGPLRQVLVSRGPLEGAETWSCPRGAVMETTSHRLELRPSGGRASLFGLGHNGAAGMGSFRILAGPPMFGGDLSTQRYRVSAGDGELEACCDWVSRPGLRFSVRYSLGADGIVRGRGRVDNGSGAPEEVFFSTMGWDGCGWPGKVLMPLEGGMLRAVSIMQLFPQQSSDLPRRLADMAAPVMGSISGETGQGTLARFEGWQLQQSGCPRTEKLTVEAGESAQSPAVEKVVVSGGPGGLGAAARAAGWDLPMAERYVDFPDVQCPPLLPPGGEVSVSSPLRMKRKARIEVDGAAAAEGEVGNGERLSVTVDGPGAHSLGFIVSGVESRRRMLSLPPGDVQLRRDGERLLLSGGGLEVSVNTAARGHVHSIRYARREWAFASDPEPRAFAWFSPWYGGIVPWVTPGGLMGRILKLEEMDAGVEETEQELWGFRVPSWRMCWTADHEDWMSVGVRWTVGMLPGIAGILTELTLEPLDGSRRHATAMICGFAAPGGDREGCLLETPSLGGLSFRRETSGAFMMGGRLGFVSGSGGQRLSVVAGDESILFAEDYSREGAFLSAMGIPDSADGPLRARALWLLEDEDGVTGLREALESFDRDRPPPVIP